MEPAAALVRDLHTEVLTAMLRTEDEGRPVEPTVVLMAGQDEERWWSGLEEPGPDEHRIAYLAREVAVLVETFRPVALAVGTAIRAVPEPHETLVIWAAERGGETMAMRMHTMLAWDGLLVPGPLGTLDPTEASLSQALVTALNS